MTQVTAYFGGQIQMKKTMSKKMKTAERVIRRNQEVDSEAVKALKMVRDDEAFYFFEAVGKPTGEIARNLSEFLDKVKSVNSESLMFHYARGDFPNWVEKVLGDTKLAEKLEKIASSNGDDARKKICKTVKSHLKELKESYSAIVVDESLVVLSPRS
jgi:uncharacterized membrane-anchored protein YjiN (DUF445 family)